MYSGISQSHYEIFNHISGQAQGKQMCKTAGGRCRDTCMDRYKCKDSNTTGIVWVYLPVGNNIKLHSTLPVPLGKVYPGDTQISSKCQQMCKYRPLWGKHYPSLFAVGLSPLYSIHTCMLCILFPWLSIFLRSCWQSLFLVIWYAAWLFDNNSCLRGNRRTDSPEKLSHNINRSPSPADEAFNCLPTDCKTLTAEIPQGNAKGMELSGGSCWM